MMAKTKTQPAAEQGSIFEPDALMIRTTNALAQSYNGFAWPREIGAMMEAPDWDAAPRCGGGLHGLLDGIGDWSLMADSPDALWWIIGVRRDEAVSIDGDKIKVPRGRVEYFRAAQLGARWLLEYEIWRNGRRVDYCRRVRPAPRPPFVFSGTGAA